MKTTTFTAAVCIILLIGCATTPYKMIEIGGYAFYYEGKTYQIESITPKTSEGYNYLTQHVGNQLVMRAIDKEQDGMLDQVLTGKIGIEEANQIYSKGITMGQAKGKIKGRNFTRSYTTSDILHNYTLKTYILAVGEIYNQFTVEKRETTEENAVWVDKDADGNLNTLQTGLNDIERYQMMYKRILDLGIARGKIVETNGKFQVAMIQYTINA